ncbi:MAG TPA: AAA family ATPase [Albitalea sp.]
MYTQFFGLKQEPFSIAPDPRYLFMSERHREALAHLLYGVNGGGGFVLLSGEIGAGKTTVCRCFLEQVPRRCNVAYIFNPKLTVTELLKSVCDEFRIPYPHEGPGVPTVKDYIDPLNEFLLRTHSVGQNNLLIIDEAQNLSADVLEQLRLLTNLETSERKLLQIILIGQPELRTMLARPELEQLAQRVIARFHLEALSANETRQYIRHRLSVAGMSRAIPFDRHTMQRIHELSRGVPRRINLLCDRALLGAYAGGQSKVEMEVVEKAASEVFDNVPSPSARRSQRRRVALAGLGLTAAASLVGAVAYTLGGPGAQTSPANAASAVVASQGAASSAVAAKPPLAASAPLFITPAELDTRFKALWRNERDAWRELAAAWKLELPDGDPCLAAQNDGLSCFRSSAGNLALIRQLDRPGILTLRDAQSQPVYALLTGLTERSATLRIGEDSQTVTLSSLAQMWRGDFATFWRVPPGYAGRVVETGPAADWLAAQLHALQGREGAGEASLKTQVSAFQLAQGLKADGLAGPTTFMLLNRAVGIAEPRLNAEK